MLRSLARERRSLLVDPIKLRSVQVCPLEVIAEDLPVLGGSVPCLPLEPAGVACVHLRARLLRDRLVGGVADE